MKSLEARAKEITVINRFECSGRGGAGLTEIMVTTEPTKGRGEGEMAF